MQQRLVKYHVVERVNNNVGNVLFTYLQIDFLDLTMLLQFSALFVMR